jgi:hypothetical protein
LQPGAENAYDDAEDYAYKGHQDGHVQAIENIPRS